MKIKKNSIILLSLNCAFSVNYALAQNAQVITNPQTNSTQLVIPLNPSIAMQTPSITNNVKKLQQLNNKTTSKVEAKIPSKDDSSIPGDSGEDKKGTISGNNKNTAEFTSSTVPNMRTNVSVKNSTPVGQVKIYNPNIVTNDIRLWNQSSIVEMEQNGQIQTMESYKNKR